jgi:histone H2A
MILPVNLFKRCNASAMKSVLAYMASKEEKSEEETPIRISRHERAGLTLSIARVEKYIKSKSFGGRMEGIASVYATALLECILMELIHLSKQEAAVDKKVRIKPRHIKSAIKKDEQYHSMFGKMVLGGGV